MLLKGTVSVGEAKSSICSATAYQPVAPIAEYCSVHCSNHIDKYKLNNMIAVIKHAVVSSLDHY